VERAVFLLADVFGEPFSLIAGAVGKSEAACRQIATRARRKIRDADGEPGHTAPASAALLTQLMFAVVSGDEDQALRLLAPDVVLVSDGGPDLHAARRPVVGSYRVHRLLSGGWRLLGFRARPALEELPAVQVETVNASPAIVIDSPAGPIVISAQVRGEVITRIWIRLNPAKTSHLEQPLEML
jgi:RNA polymerase sigma-70 factor (ECF subfamily)